MTLSQQQQTIQSTIPQDESFDWTGFMSKYFEGFDKNSKSDDPSFTMFRVGERTFMVLTRYQRTDQSEQILVLEAGPQPRIDVAVAIHPDGWNVVVHEYGCEINHTLREIHPDGGSVSHCRSTDSFSRPGELGPFPAIITRARGVSNFDTNHFNYQVLAKNSGFVITHYRAHPSPGRVDFDHTFVTVNLAEGKLSEVITPNGRVFRF